MVEFNSEHWTSDDIVILCSLFLFCFLFVLSVSFECRIVPFYASSLSVQYMWLYFVGRLHLWFGGITPQAWVGAYCT